MIQPNNYRIDEAKYKSLLKYIRLSVTEKYEFPQEIVQIDGVTIATIGNFSASTANPKAKRHSMLVPLSHLPFPERKS